MVRILTLTSYYLPAERDGRHPICYEVMSRLGDRGHRIEVLCGGNGPGRKVDDAGSSPYLPTLHTYPMDVHSPTTRRDQFRIESHNQRLLAATLARFDPQVVAVWDMRSLSLNLLSTVARRGIPMVFVISRDAPAIGLNFDPWSRHWHGSPVRRLAGWTVERFGGPPSVIPDIGSGNVACFETHSIRDTVQIASLWHFAYCPVVSSTDVNRMADDLERYYEAASKRSLPEALTMRTETYPAGDPLGRHQVETAALLWEGSEHSVDAQAVKSLYRDLGDSWWELHAGGQSNDDPGVIPVLSAPETTPIVVRRLCSIAGLVLDAGCGPNPAVAIGVGATGKAIVAMDIGLGTVRVARAKATEAGVELLAVVGDVERLPFRSHAFDGLVCDDTIEHLPDDQGGVAELGRVLKSTGIAVLATPNRHNVMILRNRFRDWWLGRRRQASFYYVANSHLREYTWREFIELVTPAFTVVDSMAIGWGQTWKRRVASRLLVGPLRRFSQIIVLEARPR